MDYSALPCFPRKWRLGHVVLLGEKVEVYATTEDPPLNAPCLYEFTVRARDGRLRSAYVGQAGHGLRRPISEYPTVLAQLRRNRLLGLHVHQATDAPYKAQRPWGFRWVHHELEAVLHARTAGEVWEVALCVQVLPFDTRARALLDAEALAIDECKRHYGSKCLNGKPAMGGASLGDLDPTWRPAAA